MGLQCFKTKVTEVYTSIIIQNLTQSYQTSPFLHKQSAKTYLRDHASYCVSVDILNSNTS